MTADLEPLPESPEERLSLLELLDRVLDKGVVLSGDITLSVADVDLVYVGLRVLLSSVDAEQRRAGRELPPGAGGANESVR
jgi:hypothetical protein